MMKTTFAFILTLIALTSYSQTEIDSLLIKGKAEFKKEFDEQDFGIAVKCLEKFVALNPNHPEGHYFLGYAYSRLNSKDGKGMIQMELPLTLKCSQEMEIVNKLTRKYQGEIVVVDPYSKLTGEWGSMAMSYWHNNKPDSAIWAFKEGKRRGGFGDFFLFLNKAVLDLCSPNSILISNGDNSTIPLWYLQIVENYRKDVSVIDINLLNTIWYPSYLSHKELVQFDLPDPILDTIEYCKWSDSKVLINDFSWTVKPSYYDQYLLRGDRIFLSLLKQNNFKKDLYFTIGFPEESRLSLKNYLEPQIIVDKLNKSTQSAWEFNKYKLEISKSLLIIQHVNKKSQEELNYVDRIRYDILSRISAELEKGKKKNAKELFLLLDKYADDKKYPYQIENGKRYLDYIRGQL